MDPRDEFIVQLKKRQKSVEDDLRSIKEFITEQERLKTIEDLKNLPDSPETRFTGMFPRDAIGEIYRDRQGSPILTSKMLQTLLDGGIAKLSKRRPGSNVNSSIEKFIENGVLIRTGTGKNELLSLTEKGRRRFKVDK